MEIKAMSILATAFTLGVLLHSVTVSVSQAVCTPPRQQYIIAPSYVYPTCGITTTGCAWKTFSEGADIVIINPNSGPDTSVNSDYSSLVASIRGADTYITSLIGYVATNYGAKSLANIKAEIDKYNSFYQLDGIFFDEVSTNCSLTTYYGDAVNYVREQTQSPEDQDYTVFNWGTNGPECFLTAPNSADTFCTFESPLSSYSAYTPEPYMANYPESRFYHIVNDAPSANLPATVTKSKQTRAKYVYVTPDNGANPYDTAPPDAYWSTEVNAAADPCY